MSTIYRPPTPDDLNLVLQTWLHSQRNTDFLNYVGNQDYYSYYQNIIRSILQRAQVSVLSDSKDIQQIIGYAVYEETTVFILHMLYIKPIFRSFGLARSLLLTINPFLGEKPTYLTALPEVSRYSIPDRDTHKPIVKSSSAFIKGRRKYDLHYNPFLMIAAPGKAVEGLSTPDGSKGKADIERGSQLNVGGSLLGCIRDIG